MPRMLIWIWTPRMLIYRIWTLQMGTWTWTLLTDIWIWAVQTVDTRWLVCPPLLALNTIFTLRIRVNNPATTPRTLNPSQALIRAMDSVMCHNNSNNNKSTISHARLLLLLPSSPWIVDNSRNTSLNLLFYNINSTRWFYDLFFFEQKSSFFSSLTVVS